MLRKIETFLLIMVVICALLLFMAAGTRRPAQTAEETTVPTVQTTAPESESTAEPEKETVSTTAPAEEKTPENQVRGLVAQILDRKKLTATVTLSPVANENLTAVDGTDGAAARSHGRALAEELAQRAVNPVAAFWELVYEGLYERKKDESGALGTVSFQHPDHSAKQYDYTAEGARALMADLLALASQMDDGVALEGAVLGEDLAVEAGQVHHSQEEGCYYGYFSCTSDRVSYILCVYLRGGAQIDDVEFQLLYLRHASGDSEALARMDYNAKKQAAALMAAAELLMTGKTRAAEGEIPFAYEVGGANATLGRFEFTGDPDRGSLTNYRLKK